jgi:hypothetical protein
MGVGLSPMQSITFILCAVPFLIRQFWVNWVI